MIKRFNRMYFCQTDQADIMTVQPRDFDGSMHIRIGCKQRTHGQRESFVNLERDQISNLINLLRDWHDSLPDIEPTKLLWEDSV